jgi:hypothetical protein
MGGKKRRVRNVIPSEKTKAPGRVVFTGDAAWWSLVRQGAEIELGDPHCDERERAAAVAGLDLDDPESWVGYVAAAAERHSVIQVGDYVCCQGVGEGVTFVRFDGGRL